MKYYALTPPTPTHIKPLLRAHFFHQQDFRDPELYADMRDSLAVHKVLLQAHVPPYSLGIIVLLLFRNKKSCIGYISLTFIILRLMV